MTTPQRPEDFDIIRDAQYQRTLAKDNRRNQVRRWVQAVSAKYERMVVAPKWEHLGKGASKKTISACIVTRDSEHRIAPLLNYCRTFCDEIVVGVDNRTTDNTLEVCRGLADELFLVENNSLTGNAAVGAVVDRCHTEWVLRLDDDEWPEPHFQKYIAGLMTQGKYTHFKFPRLNLCNVQPLQWINDGYMYPDAQMRLFVNDKRMLTYPGPEGHNSIECEGPRGKIHSVNLVHLNMAINPRWRREAKLRNRYVKRAYGGWVHPVNEHALLFEDFNYRIEPYTYPDPDFCALLIQTIQQQLQGYETEAVAKVW